MWLAIYTRVDAIQPLICVLAYIVLIAFFEEVAYELLDDV